MSEVRKAAALLRSGAVVVIPTDTVYGLACLPRHRAAVEEIFRLKERPSDKPLPVLGDGIGSLETAARFDESAWALGRKFWPGPLTLVLPRVSSFRHDLGGDDLVTVAVRVPQNRIALELLGITGPLAVTSANRSGERPAGTVEEARSLFGDEIAAYLDDGLCDGEPSSVLSLVGPPTLVRDGAITYGELMATLPSR